MNKSDWAKVLNIYEEGINTGIATFETSLPEWEEWDHSHLDHSRFVAHNNDLIVGWAALSGVSDRCVYGGVAEVSIYVSALAQGKGIGSMLMRNLIESSEINGIWTLQAGIFVENKVSISLHLKYGFREVGVRKRLGKLNGEWKDVILLERRSQVVGI